MIESVFEIKNLWCAYNEGQPVLHLKHLNIPKGCLVFIIGRSGIGKSTFIETLGLMNKTISPTPENSILFNSPNKGKTELKNYWNTQNDEIAAFRRKNFSFIFQNTNLMPNFSAGENMAVSLLIKGWTFNDAKKEVLSVMKQLSLPKEIFDKKITELSGGQRQRLAFVRAITAEFEVIFGDEPTGNLDRNTAEELMKIFKEVIKRKEKTGIIVSHDLALATVFADLIIPITPKRVEGQETELGEIKPSNILYRHQETWKLSSGYQTTRPMQYLNQFFIN